MSQENDNYQNLVDKVATKNRDISAVHRERMQCQAGCHSCCLPGLSVSAVEAVKIKTYLKAHPLVAHKVSQLSTDNPHESKRCSLLDENGLCSIYEVRPIICRSHGVPVRVRQKDALISDVCPLNFKDLSLEALEDSDFINLELLNTLLALINEQSYPRAGRVELQWAALMAFDPKGSSQAR